MDIVRLDVEKEIAKGKRKIPGEFTSRLCSSPRKCTKQRKELPLCSSQEHN